MRFSKSILATLVISLCFITGYSLKSQVYGEFNSVHIVEKNYVPISGTVIQAFEFTIPPNTQDRNDGYHKISIGFPFEYNGEVFEELWISVNGFVTFNSPLFLRQNNPTGLFKDLPSTYQRNVLAPFWGDHVLRTEADEINGYTRSRISYQHINNGSDPDVLIIEWRDLNINDSTVQSSIADFQVILYESDDPLTPQGNIEFAYGQIGGNQNTNLTEVVTKGASVGIKGEFDDYINGLFPCDTDDMPCISPQATSSETLTNEWQPSGASNHRILFDAKQTNNVEEFWGDGDADFSKAPGGIHFGMPQNRYVTFNDVRVILKALATNVPLDSVRRRAAYHGDVDHDGRYFYNANGEKVRIKSRDENYFDNLPNEVSSLKKVFYEADEYDASIIIKYLSASVIELPWLLDTAVYEGKKVSKEAIASNIRLGEIEELDGKTVLPVYLNNDHKGPLSVYFNVSASVSDAYSNEIIEAKSMIMNGVDNVVYSASGEFDKNEPLFYVELGNNNSPVEINNIRVNGNEVGSAITSSEVKETKLKIHPNPVDENSTLTLNVNDGYYNIAVYDALGNKVKELFNGEIQTNEYTNSNFNFNELNSGVYFVRVEGNGLKLTEKIIINK